MGDSTLYRSRPQAASGFTLIEMIVVIVLIGISAVGITRLQAQVFRGQTENIEFQTGVQLLQECAEQVLAVRRKSGYASVNATTCNGLGTFSGFTPTIVVSTPTSPMCATGTTCSLMAITVAKGGNSLGPVHVMLVNY